MATCLKNAHISEQLDSLAQAYQRALVATKSTPENSIFRRIFCSDPTNQQDQIKQSPLYTEPGAVSLIGQAPVGAKVAFLAYHIVDSEPLNISQQDNTLVLKRESLCQHWTTLLTNNDHPQSYQQSNAIMRSYVEDLEDKGMTLLDNVVRTWFMVRDVDNNYQGIVDARNTLFAEKGLTPDTHYIASTGIDGNNADVKSLVYLDALAIEGLQAQQVQQLQALDYLNPTHEYGVAFERGTAIHYADRSHLYISGTASIDNKGDIIHPGDTLAQLTRTLTNIEALLAEANASGKDMSHWIIYLREISDAPVVKSKMRSIYGDAPMVFVHAPVCRPGWLIEIEGIAIVSGEQPALPHF